MYVLDRGPRNWQYWCLKLQSTNIHGSGKLKCGCRGLNKMDHLLTDQIICMRCNASSGSNNKALQSEQPDTKSRLGACVIGLEGFQLMCPAAVRSKAAPDGWIATAKGA
jgi:hypothetical protein